VSSLETFSILSHGLYLSFVLPSNNDNYQELGIIVSNNTFAFGFQLIATNFVRSVYVANSVANFSSSFSYTPGQIAALYFDGYNAYYYINGVKIDERPHDSISVTFSMYNNTNTTRTINSIMCYTTGKLGSTGPTGPTGFALSYVAGNEPYTNTLVTTTVGTSATRIYEIGPITSLSTTKFMLMANVSLFSANYDVQVTIGRSTTSGPTGGNSTNIVSNVSPLVLPQSTTSYYVAGLPALGSSASQNGSGFALDSPGAGTFYYTIWMSSSSSNNYSAMTTVLTALKIQT
jgi:hypothetical protein